MQKKNPDKTKSVPGPEKKKKLWCKGMARWEKGMKATPKKD